MLPRARGRAWSAADRAHRAVGLQEARVVDVDTALADAYRRCLAGKKAGHDIDDPSFLQPDRPMSAIGG